MSEFKKVLEKYAEFVINKSRQNLVKGGKHGTHNKSGALSKSLEYTIKDNKVSFLSEKYGEFLDKGVKGSKSTYPESSASPFRYRDKMPPPSAFDKWSIKSGIAPRDSEGKFIKRKSLNYIIANSIFRKGIRASLFFTKPFEEALPLFEDEMLEAFLNDNLEIE
ncbi:MAG: hypothetical protein CMJ25_03240 [Phycisphaerae bacterium]|nr:hypothetical protein [Phycisphaerae bacterium]|tara:strand:- start:7959 stop:8450 length:492 start_codon:yes stop_codon:yes gene_type:complete